MGRGLPLFFVHTASRAHGPDSQTMQTSIVRVPGISRDLQGLPQDPHPSFWPVSSASPPKRNDKLARRRWRHGPVLTLLLCAFELGLPKTVKRERERRDWRQSESGMFRWRCAVYLRMFKNMFGAGSGWRGLPRCGLFNFLLMFGMVPTFRICDFRLRSKHNMRSRSYNAQPRALQSAFGLPFSGGPDP